ncbi:MAG TPA: hypothetical protein VOA78_15280 [Candidatus Dormibacteraeota bacterium]|nr:hypothetical protein [Candidatus Dormibacteraeota bacterium]
MQKVLRCPECQRAMKLTGSTGFGKDVPRMAVCPYCTKRIEVTWPKGDEFRVMRVASH